MADRGASVLEAGSFDTLDEHAVSIETPMQANSFFVLLIALPLLKSQADTAMSSLYFTDLFFMTTGLLTSDLEAPFWELVSPFFFKRLVTKIHSHGNYEKP